MRFRCTLMRRFYRDSFNLLFHVVKCARAAIKYIISSSNSKSGYNNDQQEHTHTHTHIYIYIYMHVLDKQLFIYVNFALIKYS